MQILPAIDLKDGQCVRLLRGDFSTAHKVAVDAAEVARSFIDDGAEIIHVVDLDGALDGKRKNQALVDSIIRTASPAIVELGGGIRNMQDIETAIESGVGRVVLGSSAVHDEQLVKDAVLAFGDKIAVGIDALNGTVKVSGWTQDTGIHFVEFAQKMEQIGVMSIIFTDIDTDGVLKGPSIESLMILRSKVRCNLIASGGVATIEDIKLLRDSGLNGAIIGKAIYAKTINLKEAITEAKNYVK